MSFGKWVQLNDVFQHRCDFLVAFGKVHIPTVSQGKFCLSNMTSKATHNCHRKKNLDTPHHRINQKFKTNVTHTCCMNLDTMPINVRFNLNRVEEKRELLVAKRH